MENKNDSQSSSIENIQEDIKIVEKKRRVKKEYNLHAFQDENKIEIGIDEAGAGTFFGSLFVAGIILPKNIKDLLNEDKKVVIRDSKKMSQKQRDYAYDFIIKNALEYNVIEKTNKEVDDLNILQARLTGFHDVIRAMKNKPEKILIDGDKFDAYYDEDGIEIESECVIEGDNTYLCIAAASILAKTHQIRHIEKLVEENQDFKKYDIHNNHGYGTPRHLYGIKELGVTPYHRLSFGICRKFSNGRFAEKDKTEKVVKKEKKNKDSIEVKKNQNDIEKVFMFSKEKK
jgi:ribonuclease HII